MTPNGGRAADSGTPRLIGVATATPSHSLTQDQVKAFTSQLFGELLREEPTLLAVFDHAGVATRQSSLPLEWYATEHGWRETTEAYVESALALIEEATRDVLARCGLTAADIDHIVLVSSTGVATPSLDARLCNRLPFRSDVRRTPIWGLGCAGGVSGVARAREFALAHPTARVLLLAVELCSLSFQSGDGDRRTLVAASLFGDGAAAAVIAGPQAPVSRAWGGVGIALRGAHSVLWQNTEDVMGWTVDDKGLHVVFSRDIPTIVREWVRPSLDAFLGQYDVGANETLRAVLHPGGPKVLAAYRDALGLGEHALDHSRAVLREHGNMSSPTALFVLERTLAAGDIADGDDVVLGALGPGFCAEYVLGRGVTA